MFRMDGSEIRIGEMAFSEKDLLVVIDLLSTYFFPKTAVKVHEDLREMGYKQSMQVTVSMLGILEFDERVKCYYSPFSWYYPLKLYKARSAR